MTISSADCKNAIVDYLNNNPGWISSDHDNYKATNPNNWKRRSKFKEGGIVTRVFTCDAGGGEELEAHINENGILITSVEVIDPCVEDRQFPAAELIYGLVTWDGTLYFAITPAKYFASKGCMWDQHFDVPQMSDVMEGFYEPDDGVARSPEELRAFADNLGLRYDEAFEKFAQSHFDE